MRTVNKEKLEQKQMEILNAAIECFANKGFYATTTAELCRAAGMSPGTLFHYFPNKKSIIEAIALLDQQETMGIFHRNCDESKPLASIQNVVTELLKTAQNQTFSRIFIEISAEASRNSEIDVLFEETDAFIQKTLITLIKKGQAIEEIDKTLNPEHTALWIMSIAEGAVGRVKATSSEELEQHIAMVCLIIHRYLNVRGQ
ncbi:TetR/AcrR family transcriptional regulator [Pseudomonas sp. F1_0610]|uniref:TetR/AcrR family transcriptional regulator n=1 Tax=Pseudomonas sp. F1_0610 TaxID=3114284 RepID=UPI0039C2841E